MLNIYVESIADYNNCVGGGAWLSLPMDAQELEAALDTIRGNNEELFITDSEGYRAVDEFENIFELNKEAERFENLSSDEKKVFEAIAADILDEDETFSIIEKNSYYVYNGCHDMEEVAMEVIEGSGLLDKLPDELKVYFNYAEYGKDLDICGHFIPYDGGIIEIF